VFGLDKITTQLKRRKQSAALHVPFDLTKKYYKHILIGSLKKKYFLIKCANFFFYLNCSTVDLHSYYLVIILKKGTLGNIYLVIFIKLELITYGMEIWGWCTGFFQIRTIQAFQWIFVRQITYTLWYTPQMHKDLIETVSVSAKNYYKQLEIINYFNYKIM